MLGGGEGLQTEGQEAAKSRQERLLKCVVLCRQSYFSILNLLLFPFNK